MVRTIENITPARINCNRHESWRSFNSILGHLSFFKYVWTWWNIINSL